MRFHSSLVLPLAVFAACCSADPLAERRLRSENAGEDTEKLPPKLDISVLSKVPEEKLEKQIRKFVSKVPLPEGITEDQMVKLTLNALERAKTDGKFAGQLQTKAEQVQEQMAQVKKKKRQEEDDDGDDEKVEDEKSTKKPKTEVEEEEEEVKKK